MPNLQESLFVHRGVLVIIEHTPKARDNLPLSFGNVAQIRLDLFQIRDIGKQHIGVDHIFINRVEIVEQHLAPEVEFIEFLVRVKFAIDVI